MPKGPVGEHKIQIAGIDIAKPQFQSLLKPYKAAVFPKSVSYTQNGSKPVTVPVETKLREAIGYIWHKCARHDSCNQYFRLLPRKKSLLEVLTEAPILLGAMVPKEGSPDDGSRYSGFPRGNAAGRQIILNFVGFLTWNVAEVAGTLVHELAHLAGASTSQEASDPRAHEAENALLPCLLVQQFDFNVLGVINVNMRQDVRTA